MVIEATGELTKGADEGRYISIENLATAYKNAETKSEQNQTTLARVLKDDKILYYPAYFEGDLKGKEYEYYIGYAMIRYFAKQCADEVSAKYIGNLTGTVTSKDSELLQANNGIVALDKGDAVSLDSAGNINAIFISDKEHIVTTPEANFLSV